MERLPFEVINGIGKSLREEVHTPHAFITCSDLNGKDYFSASIRSPADDLAAFVMCLLEAMIDNGVNSEEILEVYTLIRKHLQNTGQSFGPADIEDEGYE